jgi:hypothetical protein
MYFAAALSGFAFAVAELELLDCAVELELLD